MMKGPVLPQNHKPRTLMKWSALPRIIKSDSNEGASPSTESEKATLMKGSAFPHNQENDSNEEDSPSLESADNDSN